jgi:hypothetical protein
VELAAINVVGRYTCREHKVCIEAFLNGRKVTRVFEHASGPYRPRLESSSVANAEATKKRKQDAGVGSWRNVRVSSQKVASVKVVVEEAAQSTSAVEGKSLDVTGGCPKTVASSAASMSEVAATVTSPTVGVLKINVRMKRPSSDPSPAVKGKQARLDVGPVLTSNAPP